MTNELSHLDAIDERLVNAKSRLATARNAKESDWYAHNVKMIEGERESEVAFLLKKGIDMRPVSMETIMSDDDLLTELFA